MESTNENSIGTNLKQLLDLQNRNGQTKYTVAQATNNISDKNNSSLMDSGYTDDDVMILDDKGKAQDIGNTAVNNQATKPGSFAINDNIRNSFKDMISKIQTPSLGALLSKTKCLNTRDKNPVLGGTPLSLNTEKKVTSSGNLFDNLKEIQIESGTNHVNSSTTVKPVTAEPDLITIDGPDNQPKADDTSVSSNTVDENSQGADDSNPSVQSVDSSSQDSTDKLNCNSDVQQSFEDISQSSSDKVVDTKTHSIHHDTDMEVSEDSVDSKSVATNSDKLDLSSPSSTNLSNSVDSGSNLGNPICDNNTTVQLDSSSEKNLDLSDGKSETVSESRSVENDLLSFNSSELEKEKRDFNRHVEEEDEVNLLSLDDSSRDSAVSKSGDDGVKKTKEEENEEVKPCKMEEEKSDRPFELTKPEHEEVKEEPEAEKAAACSEKTTPKLESLKLEVKSEKSENCEDIKLTDIKEEKCDKKPDQEEKSDLKDISSSSVTEKDSKIVPKLEEESEVDNGDRKRPADSDIASSEPKRSRLEMMIGKLGSQIGISPDAIPMEEEDASDESITDSATESTTPTSAETEEEEEESDASPRKKKKRSVRMSEKALDNLLKAKIRKFLLSEKEGIVAELQKKVEELSSLKEEWKAKARDLSKQIMDVTVLQQKYEKRKAKTAALKQISTKSIGLQVDVKLTGMMPLHQERQEITPTKVPLPHTSPHTSPSLRPVQQKTTPPSQRMLPKAPATVLTPGPPNHNLVPPKTNLITVSQNKSPMMQQSSQGTVVQQTTPSLNQINTSNQAASISAGALNPTVKNLLDTARSMNASAAANVNIGKQMLPAGYIVVTSIPNAAMIPATTKPLSSIPQTVTAVNTVVAPNQVKFIDLTVEEEGSKGVLNPSRPVQIAGGTGTVVAQPPMVVPSNTMIRHIPPTAQGMPAGGVILAPNLVPTNQQQAIQFVFNSSSPAVRPGGLISLTSAANSTSGVRTTSPVTNMASQIRAPMLVRQTAPISSNNITRPIAPPSNSVSRSSITTVPSPTTVNRPPPPLQSAPQANVKSTASAVTTKSQSVHSHPAPLPVVNFTVSPNDKPIPPRPNLKISRVSQGIVLSWNMIFDASKYAEIKSYQLYAYQEGSAPPSTSLWKKVGDVNALPLPMACTLTQFQEGNKYHFAVRPVDKLGRYGQFSDPGTIHLKAFNGKD